MAEFDSDEISSWERCSSRAKGDNTNINTPGCGEEEPPPAKRPRTISELRHEVEVCMKSGQSLTLHYEGKESLEEVLGQLFSEPVECSPNLSLEMMYQKLMSELEAAGLDTSKVEMNDSDNKKKSKGFKDSKELIEYLLQDDDDEIGADKDNGSDDGELDPRMIQKERKSKERQQDGGLGIESPAHVVVVRKEDGNPYDSGDEYKELFIDEGFPVDGNHEEDLDEAAHSSKKVHGGVTDYNDEDPVDEHLGVSLEEFISVPKTVASHGAAGTNIDELIKELDPNAFQHFQLCQGDEDLDYLETDSNGMSAVKTDTEKNDPSSVNAKNSSVENLQTSCKVNASESGTKGADDLSVIPSSVVSAGIELLDQSEIDRSLLKKHKINRSVVIRLEKLKGDKIKSTNQVSTFENVSNAKDLVRLDECTSKTKQKQVKTEASLPTPANPADSKVKVSSPVVSPSVKNITVAPASVVQQRNADLPVNNINNISTRKPQSPTRDGKHLLLEEKKRIIHVELSSSSESDDEYVPLGPAILHREVPPKATKPSPDGKKVVEKPINPMLSKKVQPVNDLVTTKPASLPLDDKQEKTHQKQKHKPSIAVSPIRVTSPKISHCKSPLRSPVSKEKSSSTDTKKVESQREHDDINTTDKKPGAKKNNQEAGKTSAAPASPRDNVELSPENASVKNLESQATASHSSPTTNKGIVTRKARGRPGRKSKTEGDPVERTSKKILLSETNPAGKDSTVSSTRSSSPESVSSKASSASSIKVGKKKPKPIISSESEVDNVSEADSADIQFKQPKTQQRKTGKTKVLPESNESLTDMMVTECFKTRPDFDLLIRIMNKTRPFRKKFLPENEFDVAIALKKFPGLRDYRIMKHEMNRLTENKGPRLNRFNMETLERKLAKEMCNASNVKKRPGLERNELWKLAIEMSKDPQKSPEEKKVLGMYCLCFHLIENDAQGSLFQIRRQNQRSKWKEMGFPTIDMQESEVFSPDADDMWVYAEGLQACKVPNFYEGVLTCYAMQYVFDMEYHEKVRNFYEHFDNIIGF